MATKFVAPVIALAFLVIASPEGNPLEKKSVVSAEKPASAYYICRRRIIALNTQMTRVVEHGHSYCRCVHSVGH